MTLLTAVIMVTGVNCRGWDRWCGDGLGVFGIWFGGGVCLGMVSRLFGDSFMIQSFSKGFFVRSMGPKQVTAASI